MDIHKFRKKLTRYLKGQSNETENALIESWYKSYATNEKPIGESDTQRIRQSIYSKVNAVTAKRSVIQLPIFRIAASLFATVSVSMLIWYTSYKRKHELDKVNYYTIQTGTNGVKQVILPDSSVIWLNSASTLRVPDFFKGHLREVKLVEGEAFFDIKRNQRHPFIVHTADLDVQVLGTSFNIRAYKILKNIQVAVATGKVGVTKGKRLLAMLLPGQQLSFNKKTAEYQQKNINTDEIQSWKSGETYLVQASFEELALVMKNIFGISLKAGNSKVNAYRFTLRIQHNLPAGQVLKVIGQIHNTHFRKEGNEVTLY